MNDIYNLLLSGKTPEEIAAEFTKNLNEAETKYKEELAAEEAKRRKLEEDAVAEAAKHADFADVVRAFMSAIGRHYPELGMGEEDITDEVCGTLADLIIMSIDNESKRISKWLPKKPKLTVQVKTTDGKTHKVKEVDPFAAFFEQFGL